MWIGFGASTIIRGVVAFHADAAFHIINPNLKVCEWARPWEMLLPG
jgi:hypothetical protein